VGCSGFGSKDEISFLEVWPDTELFEGSVLDDADVTGVLKDADLETAKKTPAATATTAVVSAAFITCGCR
jgi:hypothetical protein